MTLPRWKILALANEPSYHGEMTKKEAEQELMAQGGSQRCYLTRFSSKHKTHKISAMHGRQRKEYEHFDLCRNKYALKDSDMEFDSISELLEYYQSHRISRTLGNIGIPVIFRDSCGKDESIPEVCDLFEYTELAKHVLVLSHGNDDYHFSYSRL
jgi:hypothetical protein